MCFTIFGSPKVEETFTDQTSWIRMLPCWTIANVGLRRLKFRKESREVQLNSACELLRKPVSGSEINVIFLWRLVIGFGEVGSRVGNAAMLSTLTLWQKCMKDLWYNTKDAGVHISSLTACIVKNWKKIEERKMKEKKGRKEGLLTSCRTVGFLIKAHKLLSWVLFWCWLWNVHLLMAYLNILECLSTADQGFISALWKHEVGNLSLFISWYSSVLKRDLLIRAFSQYGFSFLLCVCEWNLSFNKATK